MIINSVNWWENEVLNTNRQPKRKEKKLNNQYSKASVRYQEITQISKQQKKERQKSLVYTKEKSQKSSELTPVYRRKHIKKRVLTIIGAFNKQTNATQLMQFYDFVHIYYRVIEKKITVKFTIKQQFISRIISLLQLVACKCIYPPHT